MGITDSIKGKLPENKSGSRKGFSVRQSVPGVNKAAGVVGKDRKAPNNAAALNHASAPLSTLKDPASFGPPPKHIGRSDIVPVARTGSSTASRGYQTTGLAANPDSVALKTAPSGSGGWGAPLPEDTVKLVHQYAAHPDDEEEEEKPKPPPVPYRANTTGIDTSHLPRPPIRMEENDTLDALPSNQSQKPRPPPRLPARQDSHPGDFEPAPPPPYSSAAQSPGSSSAYLNKGALNRLGSAGVSVPGFGIGDTSETHSATQSSHHRSHNPASTNQLSELQSRFNKMPGRVTSATTENAAPTRGTTWAQKQSAITTASQFHKDPSSVSIADAREAGTTVNNFRQRHGDQVASGVHAAQGMDKRHGVSGKVGGWAQQAQGQGYAAVPAVSPLPSPAASSMTTLSPQPSVVGKRAPPPPPPKKKHLMVEETAAPPPIPLGSRPTRP